MLHLHLHHALAVLTFLQDPDYNQNAKAVGGMIAGMMGFFLIFGLAVYAFVIFLFYRIFTKAGMSGWLSLLLLLLGIGQLIALCILAFGEWKVVPVQTASPYLPPVYPPPPPPAFGAPPQV